MRLLVGWSRRRFVLPLIVGVYGVCDPVEDRVMPQRIQLSRAKGWRKPEGTIVVARPSRWGNPFVPVKVNGFWCVGRKLALRHAPYVLSGHEHNARRAAIDDCIRLFRLMIEAEADDVEETPAEFLAELRGHDLACWCHLDDPCHADVLLELANNAGA